MQITDFMPILPSGDEEFEGKFDKEPEKEQHELYRLVEVQSGEVKVAMVFDPQFNYARTTTMLEKNDKGIIATGDAEFMALSSAHELNVHDNIAESEWHLSEGDRVWMHLRYAEEGPVELYPEKAEKSLCDTKIYWRNWLKKSETGRSIDLEPSYQNMIERSEVPGGKC